MECNIIFTNSYGYGETAKEVAKEYPDVEFCQATGDNANTDPVLHNYHTFMGEIYEGRYIAGMIAGMKLQELIDAGNDYDLVIAIGPVVMMKFISKVTEPYNIKTLVSLNPIMIDGTGMCGGCRVTVGGETKFACVDGPDFDGHQVDYDELMRRNAMYAEFEAHDKENCRLMKMGGAENA